MKKSIIFSIFISICIILGSFYLVSKKTKENKNDIAQIQNVEIKDGIQYVSVIAKGGYYPRITNVSSGIPTKLIVKTEGTYDCSAYLVIRSINFKKMLQPINEEVIDIGILGVGDKIQGVCGMGMYSFQIKTD